jgi:hypothetical protein
MKKNTPKYMFKQEDYDNCRIYYKRDNGRVYCIQDDGAWGKRMFKFYACSADGEPSHDVTFPSEDQFDRLIYPS